MVNHPSTIATERVCSGLTAPGAVVQFAPRAAHRTRPLEDEALLDEIELLLDVIVAVAAYPRHLTPEQVDAVLQLPVHTGDPDLWGSRGLNPGPTDYESAALTG